MELNLPKIREGVTYPVPHFPTLFQAVIFRCWEMIPAEKIAKVLQTTPEMVREHAEKMGLKAQKNLEEWVQKGYISILRNVWQILPYEQILELLDWDEARLNYVLKEDDFLNVKFGWFKFDSPKVVYRPLTAEEEQATKLIKTAMEQNLASVEETAKPFKFFEKTYKALPREAVSGVAITNAWCVENNAGDGVAQCVADFCEELFRKFGITLSKKSENKISLYIDRKTDDEEYHEIEISENEISVHAATDLGVLRALYYLLQLADDKGAPVYEKRGYKRKTVIKTRFIYSFSGLYGDVLDVDNAVSFTDDLLKQYAKYGINGVWIQAVLYKLVPFAFDESISAGWQARIDNLRNLIQRADRYGIKVYLYINEPRGMPHAFFERFPHLRGSKYKDGLSCLCTSKDEVKNYLRDAITALCKAVPGLGGFFNICMSENLTHCRSREDMNKEDVCPVCKNRAKEDVAAEVVSIIANAVKEADPSMKFFSYSWAWERVLDMKQTENLIKQLPQNVILLNVSENWMDYEIAGTKGNVIDYTLSMPGPSEWSKHTWAFARKCGLETAAKVQINNSWECSSAPFLPVYDSVLEHVENLKKEKVSHIMLSWTLGGYPSDNIKIATSAFFEDENDDGDAYRTVLQNSYGKYADTVKKAATHFSQAFREFPFSCASMYYGPQNVGTANLMYSKPSGFTATMTCYAYDDLDTWRSGAYSEEVYENQYRLLCEKWEKGLEELREMPTCEFSDMALYGYTFFKSSYNQVRFIRIREKEEYKTECVSILKDEINLAKTAYEIMSRNSAVGYEAANHYYVNKTMLAEKIVSCTAMLKNFE